MINSTSAFAIGANKRPQTPVRRRSFLAQKKRHAHRQVADSERAAAEAASLLAEAFSHPLRVQILKALTKAPGSAKTISVDLGVELGNVSYHLKEVLDQKCGLVARVRQIKRRGAHETVYRINGDQFLRLMQIAGPMIGAVLAGAAWGEVAAEDDGTAMSPGGFAALRLGSVDKTNLEEIQGVLRGVDDCVSSPTSGQGIDAIFGYAAVALPPLAREKS